MKNGVTVPRGLLEAVITALDVPRNRFGKLDGDSATAEPLRTWAVKLLPSGSRGATDRPDQVVRVLRAVLSSSDRNEKAPGA